MSYTKIGKEAWDALPNIFSDPALAATLEKDTKFKCATGTEPHSGKSLNSDWVFKTESAYCDKDGNSIATCVNEYGVSYSVLTGLFTKWMRLVKITTNKDSN